MQQSAVCLRIARLERNIEFLHHRLHNFTSSQTADALYARTRLYVLKRSLEVLRTDRTRKNDEKEDRPLLKRRLHVRHQQNTVVTR